MELQRVDDYRYRIPRDKARGMRTDALIFASAELMEQIRKDRSLEQTIHVSMLPGIVGPSLAMPDIHQGYGFPIGGVAATDWRTGVVSPGGVGFDINCGVRLLRASVTRQEVQPRIQELVNEIAGEVPCGTGGGGPVNLSGKEMEDVLLRGAQSMVERNFGNPSDTEFCEERGALADANPDTVSGRAKERGKDQLGTLGSGNHFLEIQYVESIDDSEAARAMGLQMNQIVVLVHSGSRGLGHQVCTDYLRQMGDAMKRYEITLPDRQLACVPIHSPEGQSYLAAMRAAANFAWANRQTMLHFLRRSFQRVFGPSVELEMVYDVCHNIAKREEHQVNGNTRNVLVHRKGATRAFPPGHLDLPPAYRKIGQPVLVPGSMGTASWVLAGRAGAMEETFGSVCHGAGRLLSRTAAKKGRDARDVQQKLQAQGIFVKSETRDGILEEIPEAYKDVDLVVDVVSHAGLACKVARLRPIGVLKG